MLIFVCVLIVTESKSQSLSKNEKAELVSFCDSFNATRKIFNQDTSNVQLKHMVTDSLYAYFSIERTYFLLEDITLHYLPIQAADAQMDNGHFQCLMHNSDTFLYSIDLKKEGGHYLVYGFNNNPFKQEYYDLYKHMVDSVLFERGQNAEIDSVVAEFLRAYDHFSQTGETRDLASNSIGIDLELLALDREVDSIEGGYFKRKFKIRSFDKTRRLTDSTATCEVSTTSGGADFSLLNKNDRWYVTADNDLTRRYFTRDSLLQRKKKALTLEAIDAAVDAFDSITLEYLKGTDAITFEESTSPQVLALLSLFKNQIGDYKPNHIRARGIGFSSRYGDVAFNADLNIATITKTDSKIILKNTNGWKVVSIDQNNFSNNSWWMYTHFQEYVALFGAYLYPYDDDDDDVEMVLIADDGAEDSSVLDQLTKFKVRPVSTLGTPRLISHIDSLSTDIMIQNPELVGGTVYVDFIIEKNGRISDVEIARSSNQVLNGYAIHILNTLPNWAPAVYYSGFTRSRHVLPISFQRP